MKNHNKIPTLQLEVQTWQKDSHGLFDYEATKLKKDYFEIQGPCKLFRNWYQGETLLFSNDKIKKGILPDDSFRFVSSIALMHNGNSQCFKMYPAEKPSQDVLKKDGNAQQLGPMNVNAYIVVKQYKGNNRVQGYPLQLGNIIKLGRVQYKIIQMGSIKKNVNQKEKKQLFLGQFNGIHDAKQHIAGNCKFCLCDDSDPQNFMISPCKCKGSCQGVHVQCLKMWIDSKVKKQVTGMVVSYNFTKFECQICKQPFPRIVKRDNFQLQMITIDRPSKPYLILQGINQRKESKQERCLHVVCPDNGNVVKIGRGHQCEIRLQDISVSRQHSEIKFSHNEFYLIDSNSKFGTLVRVGKAIQLNSKIKLQIGRSLFKFQIE